MIISGLAFFFSRKTSSRQQYMQRQIPRQLQSAVEWVIRSRDPHLPNNPGHRFYLSHSCRCHPSGQNRRLDLAEGRCTHRGFQGPGLAAVTEHDILVFGVLQRVYYVRVSSVDVLTSKAKGRSRYPWRYHRGRPRDRGIPIFKGPIPKPIVSWEGIFRRKRGGTFTLNG